MESVARLHDIAMEHGLTNALHIKNKVELKKALMRHARVVTIYPTETQSTLRLSASLPARRNSRSAPFPAGGKGRRSHQSQCNGCPRAPASAPVMPTSSQPPSIRRAKQHRLMRSPSLEFIGNGPLFSNSDRPIILLSDDGDDPDTEGWSTPVRGPQGPVDKPAAKRSDRSLSVRTVTRRGTPELLQTPGSPDNAYDRHDEGEDQLAWSDEGEAPHVPAYVVRARKSKAVADARKRRQGQDNPSLIKKTHRLDADASRSVLLSPEFSDVGAAPANNARADTGASVPQLSRWRHC